MATNSNIFLSVGTKAFEPSYVDGPTFDLTENGFVLTLNLRTPTAQEICEARDGRAEFRFHVVDGILVFMLKLGLFPWMDCTFHRGLSPSKDVIRPEPGQGTALTLLVVDSDTGILKAIRMIGLSNDFSHALADEIEKQDTNPPDLIEWAMRVCEMERTYTTSHLVAIANHRN